MFTRLYTASTISGKTKSVKAVAPINPPMMTMANGRWLSDPMPWLSAAGNKPSVAIIAVISTERMRE